MILIRFLPVGGRALGGSEEIKEKEKVAVGVEAAMGGPAAA